MNQFSFKINKNQGSQQFPQDIGAIYQSGDKSIWVAGELIGAIFENQVLSDRELIDRVFESIDDQDLVHRLISAVVGDAYMMTHYQSKLELYVSMSAPGLFYHVAECGDVLFSNMERDLFEQVGTAEDLDEDEMITSILSHQILTRTPFYSIFKSIKRVIGGSKVCIDQSGLHQSIYFLKGISEKNKSWKDKKKEFTFLVEHTVKLLKERSQDEVVLFKSGGIDSSVLLASFEKNKGLDCYHLPYFGMEDNSVKLAQDIVGDFGQNLLMGEIRKEADLQKLKRRAGSGLGTVVGPQYLLTDVKMGEGEKKVNALSGQNLDTIYYIDTFAPGSLNVGLKGFLFALKKLPNRIFFHKSFHKAKWWLKFFPFKVPQSKLNRPFEEYLISMTTPHNEHGVLFEKDHFPSEIEYISSLYETTKVNHLYRPFIEVLSRQGIADIESVSIEKKLILAKTLRWYRTVQNVPANYQNLEDDQGIRRIIPYTTGPLATFLLGYQLSFKEMFFIKRLCHSYFKSKAGRSHASYVKKLGIEGLLALVWREKVLRKKSVPVKKDFSKELDILNQLLGQQGDILFNLMKGETQKKFMHWAYHRLKNHTKFEWDQKMVMLMCRFVNMHVLLYEVLEKRN